MRSNRFHIISVASRSPFRQLCSHHLGVRAFKWRQEFQCRFSMPNGFSAVVELVQRQAHVEKDGALSTLVSSFTNYRKLLLIKFQRALRLAQVAVADAKITQGVTFSTSIAGRSHDLKLPFI